MNPTKDVIKQRLQLFYPLNAVAGDIADPAIVEAYAIEHLMPSWGWCKHSKTIDITIRGLVLTEIGALRLRGLYTCKRCGETKPATQMQSTPICLKCFIKKYPSKNLRQRPPTPPIGRSQMTKGDHLVLMQFYELYDQYACEPWPIWACKLDVDEMVKYLHQIVDYKCVVSGDTAYFKAIKPY
jgi:hypothetical protein